MIQPNFIEGRDYWILNNQEYNSHFQEVSQIISENFENEKSRGLESSRTTLSIDTEVHEEKGISAVAINPPKFPNPNEFIGVKGKNTTKHVIMTVRCFKKFLMMLNTSKANTVREFYLMLEELIQEYTKYQALFLQTDGAKKDARIDALIGDLRTSNKELATSNAELKKVREELTETRRSLEEAAENLETTEEVLGGKLDKVSRKLGIAVEDRVVKQSDPSKFEHFALYALRDSDAEYTHYTLRVKQKSFSRAKENLIRHFPNATMILHIKAAPNARSLYDNIREKIKGPKYSGNYIALSEEWPEERFVESVRKIYAERKEVKIAEYEA